MIGYKLFRKRLDGTYGPLFINRKQRLLPGVLYEAESHPTFGYTYRPYWHICSKPEAPHLTNKNRIWCKVEFDLHLSYIRPMCQGGVWHLGNTMTILEEMSC